MPAVLRVNSGLQNSFDFNRVLMADRNPPHPGAGLSKSPVIARLYCVV
ncbi:MAG: hypothetical protein HN410_14080 [Prolixibacteraceae bacterium]|nr:hypothetical protein [Prolixibacteraceae bacterium]